MSYTNTINPTFMYKPYSYTSGVTVLQRPNSTIFNFDPQNMADRLRLNTDSRIRQLRGEFKLAKDEQGCIGKAWNGIKNLFNTQYSLDNIEKAINNLTSNSTDEEIDDIRNMIAKYRQKQDLAVDTIATTGATITAGTIGAKVGAMIGATIGSIIPGAGTVTGGVIGTVLGFVGGAIVGAVAKVGISQLENMTDNVDNNAWHNDKSIVNQVTSGALAGASAMLFGSISEKISGFCKSAFNLTEEGIAISANGTAKVAKTVALNALAEGAGGAVASVAVCDGEYLIECALDEDTEFSWNDLAQTTGISAATGGIISAGFGAISGYKGANNFNKINKKPKNVKKRAIKNSKPVNSHSSKFRAKIQACKDYAEAYFENMLFECSFNRIESSLEKLLKRISIIRRKSAFHIKKS